MDKNDFLSRARSARLLGVSPYVMDRLANVHKLQCRQVPGHSRRYYLRAEVERLVAAAEVSAEARA